MGTFGAELRRLREGAGLSQSAVAKRVGLNASYINRLESGEREPPRAETVLALADGLGVSGDERDRLLVAAGHLPVALAKLGAGDPTICLVAEVLADDGLPLADRQEFREALTAIARRWSRRAAR